MRSGFGACASLARARGNGSSCPIPDVNQISSDESKAEIHARQLANEAAGFERGLVHYPGTPDGRSEDRVQPRLACDASARRGL